MNGKPVQRMVLCLLVTLPCIAFAYQGEQLKVKVSVRGGCTTTGNDEAHFGEHISGTAHTGLAARGAVHYWCSVGTTHTISVDDGQNYTGGTRHMQLAGGTETIPYSLSYVPDTDTGVGPTPPAKVDVTVNLVANALQNATPGEYEDTVTVTVEP